MLTLPVARGQGTGEGDAPVRGQPHISSVFDTLTVTPANVGAIARFDVVPALGRGLSFEVGDRQDPTVFSVYRRLRIVKELTAHGWSVDEESAYA